MNFFAKNLTLVVASIVLGIFSNIGVSFFSHEVVAPTCKMFKVTSLYCADGLSYQVMLYTFVAMFFLWFLMLRILLWFWLK